MSRFLFLLCSVIFLAGCGTEPSASREQPLCRVVTQVEILEENPSGAVQRLYRTQSNMNRILSGISLLGHKFPAAPPPQAEPDAYRIILYFSDGNQKIYRYHALRYLYIEGKGWKRVNEELSEDFLALMQNLPEET